MNKSFQTFLLIIFIFGVTSSAFSQTDKRIEEIRKIYQETNQKIAESEADGETSTTFLTEMVVNKNNGSYPAVGIYKTMVRFYYTFGDREENPYPDRLLKIIITTNRSAMTENSEYLFNEIGRLIFYFEKKDEVERRIYFEAEKPFIILQGEKTLSLGSKQAADLVKTVLGERVKLNGIFQNSLQF